MNRSNRATALTIAGSDSSGGAGIQADLKTFAAHRVTGQSVVASITAQNTRGVLSTFHPPSGVVADQLEALFADGQPDAVKTGMLGNAENVQTVARLLKRRRVWRLVVDPVIRSSGGKTLLSAAGVRTLMESLLPLATLVTPNLKEAEILSGVRIKTPKDRLKAARAILKTGVASVLIKGGHLRGRPEDFYFDGGRPLVLDGPRLTGEDVHGTGCVLAAAIAAQLALGEDPPTAVCLAKKFIGVAIRGAIRSGEGVACVEPLAGLYREEEKSGLIRRLSGAMEILKEAKIGRLVPEVQSNIGIGLEGATGHDDVLAFPGRINRLGDDIVTFAPAAFGGSRHVANVVLAAMRHDPAMRAVMNIRCDSELIAICRRLKFSMASFDRAEEPVRVKVKEGSSLEWGTDTAIGRFGRVPDIVYDLGGMGKEEMIRVIAPNIEMLVEKVLKIHRLYRPAG
jgi:hydroxymethylpyrimidine/phosphomethylpyrimidine kinase